MLTPHKIEARLACRVVEDLRQRGVLADDLLKEVGLRRADVADPEARIPYAAVVGPRKRAATGVFPRVGGQSGHLETGRPLFRRRVCRRGGRSKETLTHCTSREAGRSFASVAQERPAV